MSYRFRRMRGDDLPMAHCWLETPDVRRWWSDPDGEVPIDVEDLDDPHIRMWIVSHAGRAFAYLQDYDPHDWPMHHFGDLPPGSRGIDQFIGEPDMLLAHRDQLMRTDLPSHNQRPARRFRCDS
jgi:aminoglycoside 6'-N-acetyltransferase